MTKAYKWLRGGAVTMGAAAIIASGPGIARADEPSLFAEWSGNGRSLKLAPDGTGTLGMVSGASSDGEKWSVTWKGDPSQRVTISLASLISRSGAGLDLKVGDQYVATLQKSSGYTVLDVGSEKLGVTVMSCTLHRTQHAPLCGA
ncbi:hypothetical protein [Mycobacterium sp.]|jgi:hypothetical protein|uniref:hypothetical protein n=1 Tax=Mycobacterium sp. TaxID=1785 RepID=UPI002D2D1C07|nr:hypothetical protein [Mycobacterium sp.]HZA08426.1 hypothetical protein [Mycobacterium sp.]